MAIARLYAKNNRVVFVGIDGFLRSYSDGASFQIETDSIGLVQVIRTYINFDTDETEQQFFINTPSYDGTTENNALADELGATYATIQDVINVVTAFQDA